jgi:DNA (cytosine-5)-methyltransferase 1
MENVEGLLSRGRGFDEVLGDLASSGFDATWRVLRASDFAAPHHRPRVWLVGYTHGLNEPDLSLDAEVAGMPELRGAVQQWPDSPRGLGVADGIPERVDRVVSLGNSVVPRVVEWIGRQIVSAEQ